METIDNLIKQIKSCKPTKYDVDKHLKIIMDVFHKGEGVMAFCAEAGICKDTFYDWLKVHKEFKKAYKIALNIAGRQWEAYPLNNTSPNFNFPYWSTIMRNRFGYGKTKVQIVKDATPIARMNAIWEGLEEGELSAQEATQLSSVANTHASILVNQKQGTEPFELETKEEIMAKVYAIQKVIDYKNGKL